MNLICKPDDNKKANLKRKIVTLNERTGDVSIYFIRGNVSTHFRKDLTLYKSQSSTMKTESRVYLKIQLLQVN